MVLVGPLSSYGAIYHVNKHSASAIIPQKLIKECLLSKYSSGIKYIFNLQEELGYPVAH